MRNSSSKIARYWVHGKDSQCYKKLKKKIHQSMLVMSDEQDPPEVVSCSLIFM
jgi:hypothetical protein